MSAAEHDREAKAHAVAAKGHESEFDPEAKPEAPRCRPRAGGIKGVNFPGGCWSSLSNPTAKHLSSAQEHQRQAAAHRAASAELRDAEAKYCLGISLEDRDMSPFEHIDDIAGVEPLVESSVVGKVSTKRTAGATITFRAVPGMTAEWLQSLVDCHVARNAVMGHVAAEMPNCPLVPAGVSARALSTGTGFAVAIRSDDDATSRDILARAERLRP